MAVDDATVADLLRLQKKRCAGAGKRGTSGRCSAKLNVTGFEVDHIMPRALGGIDGRRNYQLLCPDCNRAKGRTSPYDYYRSRGLLL